MKINYSYNEMKRAFECGRNFQLTGENNFQELIEELNQAHKISSKRVLSDEGGCPHTQTHMSNGFITCSKCKIRFY